MLCVIYFSTIVDLIRKLRIFVLEETKLEANLIRLQFFIFFLAYGSKVIATLFWIKKPPYKQDDDAFIGYMINNDILSFFWTILPFAFVMWM